MSDSQILLLPHEDYWQWVRASREYVREYEVKMTADPETAARAYGRHPVVTIAATPGGYPAFGDIQRWFQIHSPGIRLDLIPSATPDELRQALVARVLARDRFGRTGKPFTLHWPTDYPLIEQPFGVHPDLYRRWGLPGHEGLDIRAPMNTSVYACEDGTVFMTNDQENGHPYGIHLRIRHRQGYQTIYAHLARHYLKVGQQVTRGQKIGDADSTGNAAGSYLHLTLKREGATAAGETSFPRDILNPTPFLIWPDEQGPPAPVQYPWPAGKCLVGVHGRADGPVEEADFAAVRSAGVESVKLTSTARPENVDQLRAIRSDMFVMVRLFADFRDRVVRSDEFAAWLEGDLTNFYDRGVRYFEIHNEPNLLIEGWQRSWQDGRDFGRWHLDVMGRLRAKFPGALFGFPGLSPGAGITGQRTEIWTFLQQADEAARASDWVGVHCYWLSDAEMAQPGGGRVYEEYRRKYPDKLLFITEFSNPGPWVDVPTRGQQYVRYYNSVRGAPGVGAAFAFVLSASVNFPHEVWRREDGSLTDIPGIVSRRVFA